MKLKSILVRIRKVIFFHHPDQGEIILTHFCENILFIGCAYIDGKLPPEEAIMMSYAKGYGFRNAKNPIIKGIMAAVAISYNEMLPMLPEGIFICCRNSSTCITIAGPEKMTLEFLAKLSEQGIFVRQVESAGFALHTKYIDEVCTLSTQFLKTVWTGPRPITSKWISSSIPEDAEQPEWAKSNCPEYHYNNFRYPVQFEQIYKHVPEDAIVVEVAPHGYLQAILKREFGSEVTNIATCDRQSADNEKNLLIAIGK